MAANIKFLKLATGEEILAEVLSQDDKKIEFKNPVRVVVIPQPPQMQATQPKIGLAPWAEFSDDKTFTISSSHIVCVMNPIKEFTNQYNTIFGGIVTPKSNLILPNG